jgi:hypothetical protein
VAAESNNIRVGTQGTQTATYIAGISGSMVTGDAVMVSGTGQLGIVMSSARYKRDIQDMDAASVGLLKLRPVTFRYKQDPKGERQYGLIAEEVARVYPELVSRGTDEKVESVHYFTLIAMLLNEFQKQAKEVRNQSRENEHQAEQIQQLTEQSEQQAVQNRRLSAQVAQLKGMFEQAMAAQRGTRSLAAAFNR